MCSVSAVSAYYTDTYPNRLNPYQQAVPMPNLGGLHPVVHTFDAETKEMMRQALKLLDKIDKRLGDIECLDDAKAGFMKALDLDPNNIGGG
jgi:hypothetical protein